MNEFRPIDKSQESPPPSTTGPIPTAEAPVVSPKPRPTGPRMRTIVFGLVMLAIGLVSLVTLVTQVEIDPGTVALALLIGAGALLVGAGARATLRDVRGGSDPGH